MTKLCVLGLGHIGLPTAALFAKAGLDVVGVDTQASVVAQVNDGRAPFAEPGLSDLVSGVVRNSTLRAVSEIEPADTYLIAVPTLLGPDYVPDLQAVEAACSSIASVLDNGNLVVVESTLPPGAFENTVRATLDKGSGLKAGRDYYLTYCPERAIPGATLREMAQNDRLIGGIDAESTVRATSLYASFVTGNLLATDAATAELAKLAENTYRDVNIALANEIATLAEQSGADAWRVIELANRHPRVDLHQPGPGVGGYCIPKDPWFLSSVAPDVARLIPQARRINEGQPHKIADRALEMLSQATSIASPKVALFGVTYRGNVDDARETPALPIALRLLEAGIEVAAHDPIATTFGFPLVSAEAALRDADILLLLADHTDFKSLDPTTISRPMRTNMALDTRNILDRAAWRAAGFHLATVGVAE